MSKLLLSGFAFLSTPLLAHPQLEQHTHGFDRAEFTIIAGIAIAAAVVITIQMKINNKSGSDT